MTRKILVAILCVLALVGGVGGSLYHRAGTSIATHRAEIAALLDDLPLRHAARPALATPEEPGNVWEVLRPAFESLRDLQEMRTTPDSIWAGMESNFNLRGIPADTPRLLEEGRAALDACRRSMRRSALDWSGPLDPALPYMAARAGRALSSKGLLCWQEGRDAEAMDWLLTALSVAYDAARLGQHRTWEVLRVIEAWVMEDARFLLSEQNLPAAELTEFEHRFDHLRAQRPPLSLSFRIEGAQARKGFLEEVQEPVFPPDNTAGPGWKDLYSMRIYTARMLTALRSGFDDAGQMTWTSATDSADQWGRLSTAQREEVAARLLLNPGGEVYSLIRLEVFRTALACARFQAAQGRMPRTIEETGYAPDLGARRVTIKDDAILVPFAETSGDGATWTLRRR